MIRNPTGSPAKTPRTFGTGLTLVTFHEASLQAEGQFALRQTDYGIKPVTVAGGTIKVKDELKFSFNIVANR